MTSVHPGKNPEGGAGEPKLDPKLEELRALSEKATQGTWQRNGSHVYGPDTDRDLIAQFLNMGAHYTGTPLVENADLAIASVKYVRNHVLAPPASAADGAGLHKVGQWAIDSSNITKFLEEAGGWWKSCSGCHETNEGQETGYFTYSDLFRCYVGSGCTECGGLGVVSEYYSEADFAAMAAELEPAPLPAVPPSRVVGLDREAICYIMRKHITANLSGNQLFSGVECCFTGFEQAAREIAALAPTPGETPGQDAVAAVRGLLSEAADAIFAISPTAPSEAQIDRARTAAENLLDRRDEIARTALASARETIAAQVTAARSQDRLRHEVERERDRLRKALEFYANPEIYEPHPHGPAFDRRDVSFAARAALSPEGGRDAS